MESSFHSDWPDRRCGSGDHGVVERGSPKQLEILRSTLLFPVIPHDVVARSPRLARQSRNNFMRGATAVQWRNQRLNDRYRAVVSAHVAPGFQIVPLRDVPMTQGRGLVFVQDRKSVV